MTLARRRSGIDVGERPRRGVRVGRSRCPLRFFPDTSVYPIVDVTVSAARGVAMNDGSGTADYW